MTSTHHETEYRLLLPAAVHTVSDIVETAVRGWGHRLHDAGIEASPAPWPHGQAPDPQSPAGQWIRLYRDLRALIDLGFGQPRAELQAAERLVSLLCQAVWAGSQEAWREAVNFVKRALRDAWRVTGGPA
ncbi:hypothetical protein ACGF12_30435 [Kitasatospora sp. NPDC048296]|uniref:hypothetical protein n=1 Tax=Kitasatospora sp. NPDC048296 TaxID=3364048 RepID=UPI003723DCD8